MTAPAKPNTLTHAEAKLRWREILLAARREAAEAAERARRLEQDYQAWKAQRGL